MAFIRTKVKHTYYVNYSSPDGKSYGIIAVSYCGSEAQALSKAKNQVMRTNPKAEEYRFAIA
jgi:hypothetical protein